MKKCITALLLVAVAALSQQTQNQYEPRNAAGAGERLLAQFTGDWDAALEIAERTIASAKSLSQRTLLPRLYVWSGLIYLWRGSEEKAKDYFDEAWKLAATGDQLSDRHPHRCCSLRKSHGGDPGRQRQRFLHRPNRCHRRHHRDVGL